LDGRDLTGSTMDTGKERTHAHEPSPFVKKIRDERIAEIIDGYLRAKALFDRFDHQFRNGHLMSFEAIKEIGDILYDVKECHHLVFRRVIDPRKGRLEEARKFSPDESEIAFMNNIGLIFHILVAAKELKYVLEHYEEDTEHYQETKKELELFLVRIDALFTRGIELLKGMLQRCRGNIHVLALLWEKRDLVEKIFGIGLKRLVEMMWSPGTYEDACFALGEYYLKQAWPQKAETVFQEVLSVNPDHSGARSYLEREPSGAIASVSSGRE